jgi:hypothetical protein
MKANKILLAIIAAIAIFMTPSVLTSHISAQTDTRTQGITDEEDGNQGTTGGGAKAMYEKFQTCLGDEESTGGNIGFVLEEDIRTCFTDAGYTQGTDDDNEDEDDGGENEDNDGETSN